MKHLILLIAAAGLMILLTACGSVNQCKKLEEEDYSHITEALEISAIDSYARTKNKNSKSEDDEETKYVTMTLPSNYIDSERTQEELDEICAEMGFKSVTLNEDGTVSYVMSDEQYEEWMECVRVYVNMIINSNAYSLEYSPYKSFKANDDYSVIKLVTNDREFDKDSGYSVYDTIQGARIYNVYAQKDLPNVDIIFGYLNDEVYEEYLKEYDVYLAELYQYEIDKANYDDNKKQYDKDMASYKKKLSKYEDKLQAFQKAEKKYKNMTDAEWVKEYRGDYRLKDADGDYVTDAWVKNAGEWFYICDDGYMARNQEIELNGTPYYFDDSGYVMTGTADKVYQGVNPTKKEENTFKIEPLKPVEPEAPEEPKVPVEPTEPIEPEPEDFCTVSSSKLFN